MSEQLKVVTIDGPSGVGKSTVSRRLAARLGFAYLDTGAMYRSVALKCEKSGIDVADEAAVAAVLDNMDLQLEPAPSEDEEVRVLLDGEDVSEAIRTPEMSMLASEVSALPSVRLELTRMQQRIGAPGKIVAEGRDMGTVVFPGAAWKFYLEADPRERARRRVEQLRARGQEVDEQEILAQVIERDQNDQNRTIAPLKAAEDAIHVDTTELDAGGVLEVMYRHVTGHE